jgi:hypothetical protein
MCLDTKHHQPSEEGIQVQQSFSLAYLVATLSRGPAYMRVFLRWQIGFGLSVIALDILVQMQHHHSIAFASVSARTTNVE